MIAYMKARINERSTIAFWLGGLGTVTAMPYPANVFLGAILFLAGFLPDGTVIPSKPDA